MRFVVAFGLFLSFVFCFSLSCYAADGCEALGTNENWSSLYEQLLEARSQGDKELVRQYGEKMSEICDRSPILNFVLADNFMRMEDLDNALKYYRKTTEESSNFDIDPELHQRFWEARRQCEKLVHERDEKAVYQAEIDKERQALLQSQSEEIEELERRLVVGDGPSASMVDNGRVLVTTGASLSGVGASSMLVGGILFGYYHGKVRKPSYLVENNGSKKLKNQDKVVLRDLGIGLLVGGGAVLTTGVILWIVGAQMKSSPEQQLSFNSQGLVFRF